MTAKGVMLTPKGLHEQGVTNRSTGVQPIKPPSTRTMFVGLFTLTRRLPQVGTIMFDSRLFTSKVDYHESAGVGSLWTSKNS